MKKSKIKLESFLLELLSSLAETRVVFAQYYNQNSQLWQNGSDPANNPISNEKTVLETDVGLIHNSDRDPRISPVA